MPGQWEGDLIKGAFNRSAVNPLVERSSRLRLLVWVENDPGGLQSRAQWGTGTDAQGLYI